jgi:acetyltransferase-like isoleucine patch superfamily enzyme
MSTSRLAGSPPATAVHPAHHRPGALGAALMYARRAPGLAGLAWLWLTSRWKLRRCTSAGARVLVAGRLIVCNDGALHLGERVRIRGTHVPVELATLCGGTLRIGDRTFINSGVSICAQRSVTIGEGCAIGNYTLIMDTDFHAVEDYRKQGEAEPVVIEEGVWLAARVTVLKGVRIGRGAVVAAGAVVTRDVPPHTLVGGVPARVIRSLDPGAEQEPVDTTPTSRF